MGLTDLFASNRPTTARKPIFTVQMGSGGAADTGLGGLATSVGSALGVNLGGGADPWQQHLVAVRMESGLAPFVDVAEIALAITPQSPSVAVGDSGSLSLGYSDDAAKLVFTGTVAEVRHGLGTQQIRMINGGGVLARLRINQSFEQQSAGNIAKELAALAEVATETVESGGDYPFYVLSQGQSVYRHLAEVGRQNNFAAWFTTAGKLVFAPLEESDPVATFTYGDNVLALQAAEAAPIFDAVTVTGEGAAGSQGAKAWPWLIKDPAAVTSRAGDGARQRAINAPGLRTSDLTQTTAAGLVNLANMGKIRGRLLAPGAPTVTVGSIIEIAHAPQTLANGRFLVQHVRHSFTRREGFTTLIGFAKASDSAGALSVLSGLF